MLGSPFKGTIQLARVSLLLLAVLGFLHLSSSAVARDREAPNCLTEGDARDQYGAAITLVLVDRLDAPQITLDVPVGLPLSIDGVGPDAQKRSPLSACAPEPVRTGFVYFVFNHKVEENIGFFGDLTIGRMVVGFSGVSAHTQYAHMERVTSAPGTERVELPNGFTRNAAVGDGHFGNYIMQAGGDVERPIYMSCSPAMDQTECRVNHQWDNGLGVTYWFDYEAVDPADWISLDRAVRDAVGGMLTGGRLQ